MKSALKEAHPIPTDDDEGHCQRTPDEDSIDSQASPEADAPGRSSRPASDGRATGSRASNDRGSANRSSGGGNRRSSDHVSSSGDGGGGEERRGTVLGVGRSNKRAASNLFDTETFGRTSIEHKERARVGWHHPHQGKNTPSAPLAMTRGADGVARPLRLQMGPAGIVQPRVSTVKEEEPEPEMAEAGTGPRRRRCLSACARRASEKVTRRASEKVTRRASEKVTRRASDMVYRSASSPLGAEGGGAFRPPGRTSVLHGQPLGVSGDETMLTQLNKEERDAYLSAVREDVCRRHSITHEGRSYGDVARDQMRARFMDHAASPVEQVPSPLSGAVDDGSAAGAVRVCAEPCAKSAALEPGVFSDVFGAGMGALAEEMQRMFKKQLSDMTSELSAAHQRLSAIERQRGGAAALSPDARMVSSGSTHDGPLAA